jgi:CBS domain containing-hemolysin-like protein
MELLLFLGMGLLVAASALTSMTEAALFSVRISRIHLAVEEKRPGSRRLLALKKNLQRPVAAIVILNNVFNIAGSICVGILAENIYGGLGVGVVTACLTFCIIVFAEIIPKTIGARFCDAIALSMAPVVLLATRVLLPVILLAQWLASPLNRFAPADVTSEEEIRVVASLGRDAGTISSHESDLIMKTLRLDDRTAREIMTHRLKVQSLARDTLLRDLEPAAVYRLPSRIVVTEDGDHDKVSGVVYQRDLLLAIAEGRTARRISELKRPAHFVHGGTRAHRLLQEFQRTRQHLFVVVDEDGRMSGVVTLEDVLEELVGEIEDETDAGGMERTAPRRETAA